MGKKQLFAAVLELPVDDQVALMHEIEKRIPADYIAVGEDPEFIAELDRRLEECLKDPSRLTPWEKVRQEMKAAIGRVRKQRTQLSSMTSPKATSAKPSLRTKSNGKG